MFITANGMLVRIVATDIRTIGRNTKGVKVVNLKDDDKPFIDVTAQEKKIRSINKRFEKLQKKEILLFSPMIHRR